MFLADIIVLRSPFDIVISFGDLILAVGLADMSYHASRKPNRRPKRRERTTPSGTDMEVALDVVALGGVNGMSTLPPSPGIVDLTRR